MKKNTYKSRSNREFGSYKSNNNSYQPQKKRYFGKQKYAGSNYGYRNKRAFREELIAEQMFISRADATPQQSIYDESMSFNDFNLNNKVKDNIYSHHYKKPTKIQAQVIDYILNGKDVLGLASTGSGKTAAFLIPLINSILNNPEKKCLIVAPTRELVNQIQSEYKKFSQGTFLRDVLIVGGASYSTQIRLIKRVPHFVIATPGRLLDLIKNNFIDLGDFESVVLDEVDTMLDMGFIHDVKEIISKLKQPRQSLFFSATMNEKLKGIATAMLTNPEIVEVEKQEAVKNVDQNVIKVGNQKNKLDTLHELLINTTYSKVLVFARTKRNADQLAKELRGKGHKSEALHGNKSLNMRTKILAKFKQNEIDVLVATDVASRGIDVPDISHVINYDKPATYADYIHRIGRTGRIGKKGIALTFV